MESKTKGITEKPRTSQFPVAPAEIMPLSKVLHEIAQDSGDRPQDFLDETVVPFGGE